MGAKHVSERKRPGHTDTSTGPRCLLSIIHGQAETVLEELMSPQEVNLIFDRAGFIAPPPHHRWFVYRRAHVLILSFETSKTRNEILVPVWNHLLTSRDSCGL